MCESCHHTSLPKNFEDPSFFKTLLLSILVTIMEVSYHFNAPYGNIKVDHFFRRRSEG